MTGSMLAVALTAALDYPSLKITLFETHYNVQGIAERIFPKCMKKCVAEDKLFYWGGGRFPNSYLPVLYKKFKRAGDCMAVEVLQDSLYFIPRLSSNRDLVDYEFYCIGLPLLEQYNTNDNIALIDTRRGNNMSTKTVLEQADVVVVVLSQNLGEIQDFFQNYSSLIPKAFFIIGNYDKDNDITLDVIRKEYLFRRDRLGIIPYLDEYEQAMAAGRAVEFFMSNHTTLEGKRMQYFMQELKKTTFLLSQQSFYREESWEKKEL